MAPHINTVIPRSFNSVVRMKTNVLFIMNRCLPVTFPCMHSKTTTSSTKSKVAAIISPEAEIAIFIAFTRVKLNIHGMFIALL